MAVVNKTIGTTARDYSTFTLWESDDGGGDGLGNDDCTGSAYNDSVFDESWTINFSANSITVTAAVGERHDGTAGTGVRSVRSSPVVNGFLSIALDNLTIEWLEATTSSRCDHLVDVTAGGGETGVLTLQRNLLYGGTNITGSVEGFTSRPAGFPELHFHNNIIYDISLTGASQSGNVEGIETQPSTITTNLSNNTVHDVFADDTSGVVHCIEVVDNAAKTIQNNVATDPANGGAGATSCYSDDTISNATVDHNLASDTTASGTGSLDSKTSANQFVSTSPVNLHLKSGADAIDAGTDLGTTPSGVEIDIDGLDRDADPSNDPWDMGAHEFVAAAGAGTTNPFSMGAINLLHGKLAG